MVQLVIVLNVHLVESALLVCPKHSVIKKKKTQSHNCSVEDAANCSMVRHESDRANYKQKHSTDTRKGQPSLIVFQVVYWAQCLSGLKYED